VAHSYNLGYFKASLGEMTRAKFSSNRAPALQVGSPDVKSQSYQNKKYSKGIS
jgi:hypothetical protein